MIAPQFDFIIVGAGSAGCVIAERLSKNPKTSVLLVEAGGSDQKFWIKTPLGYAKSFSDPSVNWCYTTAPDPGLNNRTAFWPRGRVLGGSGSINAMAYMRGLPHDFDDWQTAGATGWNWDTVRQTYESIETHSELDTQGGRHNRGSGPVWVSDIRSEMHPFSQHFLAAARDMGWPVAQNLNGQDAEGLMLLRGTTKNGRRWSTADAYLRPALKRPNLHLVSHALVENIEIIDRCATGISYRVENRSFRATANAEIILCAGAINSPQLLQLSGIGPVDLLKQNGIKVQNALPSVGQGLQDHIAVSHYFQATEPTLNSVLGNSIGRVLAGMRYVFTRRGPLSVPVNQCSGYVRSNDTVSAPDVQIYANPISYGTNPSGDPHVDSKPGFLLCAQPSRPTSRGSVNIASNDPAMPPIIQPNSLSTKADQQTAIAASKLLQKLAQTPTISTVTKRRLSPDIIAMSDAELLENFRARAGTVFHPSCTCQMGTDAQNSVLDNKLRVHGIQNLRVIDASSFPNITSSNTNAPTIMLAERGAGLILGNTS